jgi:hypothetical protein
VVVPVNGNQQFFRLASSTQAAMSASSPPLLTKPGLTIHYEPGNILLSWPGAFEGYSLQVSPDLSPGSWEPVIEPAASVGGMNEVSVPITPNRQFFRLIH